MNDTKRPIRVLHLLHDSRRSGVPAVAYSLLTALDRAEVRPAAFFAHDGVYAADLRRAGLEVITLGRRVPFLWRCKRFLGILLLPFLLHRFDIIHAHSVKMAPMGLAAKLLGARVVFHLHEKADRPNALVRALLVRADRVVFCAENCARHYAGLPVRSGETILNAIHVPDRPGPPREERGNAVVMLGSINRRKGQDTLVRAFAALRPDNARLCLYGTVGLSARFFATGLRAFVAANGLTETILFPGPTSDAPAVLRDAALLVHASLNECLSISILEAMAHGVPVIANHIPGMDEIIEDGVNGFLVPPGDEEVLADRIGLLLDDAALWRRFSVAGRETVQQRFDMNERSRDFARLYGTLMERDAHPETGR